MKIQEFEKLVGEAMADLPKHIREKMDNVVVCVEKKPSPFQLEKVGTRLAGNLLGLYQGVPKTVWGRQSASVRLPDKITIFQEAIEKLARLRWRPPAEAGERTRPEEKIKELVKIVVWHEIAHHFGLSEKQVRNLEQKWRKK